MNSKWIARMDGRSMIVGAVLAITAVMLLGAGPADRPQPRILAKQYLVLKSSPAAKAAKGYQSHLLTVSPHYGKIDSDSLKYRLDSETQEIRMIVTTEEGQTIRRGDILGFGSVRQLKLEPGSRVVRHLRTGGQELVP